MNTVMRSTCAAPLPALAMPLFIHLMPGFSMSKTKPDDSPAAPATGIRKGLTNYGDSGFSLFLRKAFIKGAGYTDEALDRPVGQFEVVRVWFLHRHPL